MPTVGATATERSLNADQLYKPSEYMLPFYFAAKKLPRSKPVGIGIVSI